MRTAATSLMGQERPIEVAQGGGITLIPATVTRQGVCALHAAIMVSFDRPKLSLGALVLIPIGRAADGLHWITYVVDSDHVLR
jgi:hypothetical protein